MMTTYNCQSYKHKRGIVTDQWFAKDQEGNLIVQKTAGLLTPIDVQKNQQ